MLHTARVSNFGAFSCSLTLLVTSSITIAQNTISARNAMILNEILIDILDLPLAVVGGIMLPLLDSGRILDPYGLLYPILGAVASSDRTRTLIILASFSGIYSIYYRSPLFSGLFSLFGAWLILLLFFYMATFVRGLEPDQDIISRLSHATWRIYLYFGPSFATIFVKFLWPARYYIAIGLTSSLAALISCPNPYRGYIIEKLFYSYIWAIQFSNQYDFTLPDILVRVYEAITSLFNRWEIKIARRRRDRRRPSLASYQYRRLERPYHIRLLRLKRKVFFSEPSCELLEVPLHDSPLFEAVSYTWGVKPPHIPLEVDGHQLLVTSAVEELLFYRRSILGSRLFWIDAICINQLGNDANREKNEQLPLITKLYSKASRVIVWLGPPESRNDTIAIRKMLKVLSFPEHILSCAVLLSSVFKNEEDGFIAIAKMLQHPWFERIWVVQEVAVAGTVQILYHGTCVDWDTFTAATKRLGHDNELRRRLDFYAPPNMNKKILDPLHTTGLEKPEIKQARWTQLSVFTSSRVFLRKVGIGSPLPLILGVAMIFKSTDPRDKVFALLGISREGSRLPFKPDYNEEVSKIFLKATAFALSTEEWFTLFSMTGRGYISFSHSMLEEQLPSWVPDYSSEGLRGFRPAKSAGMASADPNGRIMLTRNEKIIKIQAVLFDKLQVIGPVADNSAPDTSVQGTSTAQIVPSESPSPNGSKTWLKWYFNCKRLLHSSLYFETMSHESVDQEFWSLCMCEGEYEGLGTEPTVFPVLSKEARILFEDPEKALRNAPRSISLDRDVLSNRGFDTEFQMLMYLERRFTNSIAWKAFGITLSGKMALVPPLAKEGDMLVHVRGGYMPITLRSKMPGVNKAELIGACTVLHVGDVYSGNEWEDWLLE